MLIGILINFTIGGIIALLFRRSLIVRSLLVCAASVTVFLFGAHRPNQDLAGEYGLVITLSYLVYLLPEIGVFFLFPTLAGNVVVTRLLVRYGKAINTRIPSRVFEKLGIAYTIYGLVTLGFSLWWLVGAFRWIAKEAIIPEPPYVLELALGAMGFTLLVLSASSLALGHLVRRKSDEKWVAILGAITCLSIPIGTLLGAILFETRRKQKINSTASLAE